MSVNIQAEILINRPKSEVAAFAMDSDNDPQWISGIIESKRPTGLPMEEGAQVERVAKFLGRRIEYTNEVVEYDPNGTLVMRSISGPFPMMIKYQFQAAISCQLSVASRHGLVTE